MIFHGFFYFPLKRIIIIQIMFVLYLLYILYYLVPLFSRTFHVTFIVLKNVDGTFFITRKIEYKVVKISKKIHFLLRLYGFLRPFYANVMCHWFGLSAEKQKVTKNIWNICRKFDNEKIFIIQYLFARKVWRILETWRKNWCV